MRYALYTKLKTGELLKHDKTWLHATARKHMIKLNMAKMRTGLPENVRYYCILPI